MQVVRVLVLIIGLIAVLQRLGVQTTSILAVLGAVGAKAGGASIWRGGLRVTFWGAVAMAVTAVVGSLFGAVV